MVALKIQFQRFTTCVFCIMEGWWQLHPQSQRIFFFFIFSHKAMIWIQPERVWGIFVHLWKIFRSLTNIKPINILYIYNYTSLHIILQTNKHIHTFTNVHKTMVQIIYLSERKGSKLASVLWITPNILLLSDTVE